MKKNKLICYFLREYYYFSGKKIFYYKMFFKILFFISFLTSALSINSKEYCVLSEKKCQAINGSVSSECLKPDCSKFGIKCSKNYCSKDKYSCETMKSLLKHINSLEAYKLKIPLGKTLESLKTIWSGVEKKIKNCSDVPKEWQKSDFCLNGMNCRLKIKLPLRLGGIYLITPKDCRCHGKYPIMCSKKICAKNQKSCAASKITSYKDTLELKGCANDNQYYYQNQN